MYMSVGVSRAALLLGFIALSTLVPSGRASGQTQETTSVCSAGPHRQFDFWVGDWWVATPAGTVSGRNRIDRVLEGCALLEQWSGVKGHRGSSINYYDAAERAWFQTWIDNNAQPLRLRGGLQGDRMVLEGESADSGKVVIHRLSWTPLQGGRVRQHWERSSDGRRTWVTVFDGLYTRAK